MTARNRFRAGGAVLVRYRKLAGLSQEDLAEKSAASVHLISDVERGAPRKIGYRSSLIEALADAVGIDNADDRKALQAVGQSRPDSTTGGFVHSSEEFTAFLLRPLLGRASDVDRLCADYLDRNRRLVTLTGPGGVGKTHLAVVVAERLGDQLPGGSIAVGLAKVPRPDLILPAIADVLGVRQQHESNAPLIEVVAAALPVDCLLVLDNFEHLIVAAPQVSLLLARGRGLRILVTSRSKLGVRSESIYLVPPLPIPGGNHTVRGLAVTDQIEDLQDNPAFQLFTDRAQATSGYPCVSTSADARAVMTICRHLEGLPLAIELAAAWSDIYPPTQLQAKLATQGVLSLLNTGFPDAPERHQTMLATIRWSYELLSSGEQELFRRMAVFAGGCDQLALLAVSGSENRALEQDLPSWLRGLVEKSLVQSANITEGGTTVARFRMLEPIREYAGLQLTASSNERAVRESHARYYLRQAQEGVVGLQGENGAAWMDRLVREQDNVRAALQWACGDKGDLTLGLRIAATLVGCQPSFVTVSAPGSMLGGCSDVFSAGGAMGPRLHPIVLDAAQRARLEEVISQGRSSARAITRARILLKADGGPGGPHWTDTAISQALDVSRTTISTVRRECAAAGVEVIARRRPQVTRPHKLDGAQEAHLIALTCSAPPAGHARWTLRLLANRFAVLDGGGAVSYEHVRRLLKKAHSSRG